MAGANSEFEILGLHHVALVCKDMARTVDFYTNVLGMELVKAIDLPGGMGQHFFFGMGGRECLAFFWFAEADEHVPGISNPRKVVNPKVVFEDPAALTSSHGSMNHFAFNVPAEKIEEYRQKLIDKGIEVSPIMHHDDSPMQQSDNVHSGTWVSSVYFKDPDGILLEFAAWQREIGPEYGDVAQRNGATPGDVERYKREARTFRERIAAEMQPA